MLEKLGKYRIDGVLGKGAMGIVYKGFDPLIERVVAIKSIHKQLLDEHPELGLIARFKNEAQAAGRLTHPNIVAVYEYGETDDNAFIAMEFVHSTPLSGLMREGKPADLAATVSWVSQLLRALDYAHARGVVHRDVKPANLLIERDGHLKITDFGIARIAASTLTQIGAVVGTPCYMSPEQFRGETADGRSDVFAAGVLLYQLLTGARPFAGSPHEIMYQALHEEPPAPSARNPALGLYFDAVTARAMAKQPSMRFDTAKSFMEALLQAYRQCRNPAAVSLGSEDMTVLAIHMPAEQLLPNASELAASFAAQDIEGRNEQYDQWKNEASPELESLLSTQIGPMAKLFLKKSLSQASNLDGLCDQLLQHIPSEKGRTVFLSGVHQLKKKLAANGTSMGLASGGFASSGRAPTQYEDFGQARANSVTGLGSALAASSQTMASQSSAPLTPEMLAKAEQLLTAHIGPIAKIVCKRTAAKAGSAAQFYQLLAENLPTEAERQKFLRQCGA